MVGTAGSSSDHLHVKCTQASISLTADEKEGMHLSGWVSAFSLSAYAHVN